MLTFLERRQTWSRIIGVERRSAPLQELHGHRLPDPSRLEDEDFDAAGAKQQEARLLEEVRWPDTARFD